MNIILDWILMSKLLLNMKIYKNNLFKKKNNGRGDIRVLVINGIILNSLVYM